MNTARVEFTEHGFTRAKMRSIAERRDISTGNLYTYCGWKAIGELPGFRLF